MSKNLKNQKGNKKFRNWTKKKSRASCIFGIPCEYFSRIYILVVYFLTWICYNTSQELPSGLFDQWIGSYHALAIRVKVNLGVMENTEVLPKNT